MSTIGSLALGYGLIWVLIGAYVWFIARRRAALRRQLDELHVEVSETAEKLGRERPAVAAAPSGDTAAPTPPAIEDTTLAG
jgi:CcmD family protein